jgi:hypothetical protein
MRLQFYKLTQINDMELLHVHGGSAAPDRSKKWEKDLSKESKNLMGAATAGAMVGATAGAAGGPPGVAVGVLTGAAAGVGGYMVNAYITGGDKRNIPKTSDWLNRQQR